MIKTAMISYLIDRCLDAVFDRIEWIMHPVNRDIQSGDRFSMAVQTSSINLKYESLGIVIEHVDYDPDGQAGLISFNAQRTEIYMKDNTAIFDARDAMIELEQTISVFKLTNANFRELRNGDAVYGIVIYDADFGCHIDEIKFIPY